jgi:hypothetical protein
MSPSDRKLVHDTVNEIEGLETTSEGVEPRRYVVIRPSSSLMSDGSAADSEVETGDAPEEPADLS